MCDDVGVGKDVYLHRWVGSVGGQVSCGGEGGEDKASEEDNNSPGGTTPRGTRIM